MFDVENIEQVYLKISKQIKDFLLSEKSREFFIFLFFFLVAGGFWLLQTLNNDYETEFSVPVRLRKVPDNIILTSEPSSKLHIRVKDKGTVLLNYMLGKSFYPVTIDFTEYLNEDSHVKVPSSRFMNEVMGQMKASTQLLSIDPDTLEYIYSTGVSKRIPVRLNGSLKTDRQYFFSDTLFQPDSVIAYAPAFMLDTIDAAYTQYITLNNVSDTVHQQLLLQSQHGVKLVPSSIQMVLPVDIYTEKTVEVPLQGVDFPIGKTLRAFPSKVQITFQVGVSRFREITADDFHIGVSYEELQRLGTNKYTVRLQSIPQGVSHVRINPEQVDFLIEQLSTNGY